MNTNIKFFIEIDGDYLFCLFAKIHLNLGDNNYENKN